MNRYKSSQAGFTFIEIAVVLLIGAILLASGAAMLNIYIQHERVRITQNRLQEIDDALVQYLNANGVLPCVAGVSDSPDSSDFGVQVTVAASQGPVAVPGAACKAHANLGAWTKNGLTPPGGGSNNIIVGAVPVFTLGLPDQDIADAWGNRFAYLVTEDLTRTGKYSQTEGVIEVKDSSGTDIAPVLGGAPTTSPLNTAAQYAIISFGADGAGSYTLTGVKNGKACPGGELETLNCKIFKGGPFKNLVMTMQNSNQAGTANMFDDYVIFHTTTPSTGLTPMGVVAPMAAATCPPGWQPYTGAACTPAAPYICCQKY